MVVLAEHTGDDLFIFPGKRDIQVGCRFSMRNSPLDVRRVERLSMVGGVRCLEEWQIHHHGTATSPGICSVPEGGEVTEMTVEELDTWTLVSCPIQT